MSDRFESRYLNFFKRVVLILFMVICSPFGIAQGGDSLLSGSFSSSLDLRNAKGYEGDTDSLEYGWMNFAALRYNTDVNDMLSFYISMNIQALAGFYASLSPQSMIVGLERLYLKTGNDWLGLEAGLIRIPRGYGYVFSPLDIFNTRNALDTLDPQGRPEGKWGAHATFYPADMWTVELFGLAPPIPGETGPWGMKLGTATTFSLDKISFDLLYSLSFPEVEYGTTPAPSYLSNDFTHNAGFALKADIELGLFIEALYRFDQKALKELSYYGEDYRWYNGLETALGVDYTFPEIDLYTSAEYLFYGPGYVDWGNGLDSLLGAGWESDSISARWQSLPVPKPLLQHLRHDYLFLLARFTPEQDLSFGASIFSGLDDLSAVTTVFCEYELFAGLTLQTSFLLPVDRHLFDSSIEPGELGSTSTGFFWMARLGLKMKF
jgi:hypothetical protein